MYTAADIQHCTQQDTDIGAPLLGPSAPPCHPIEVTPTKFSLHSRECSQRADLEDFIASRFNLAYGAAIVEFLPLLLARSEQGQLASVVGLRPGNERPLFIEQYLDRTLEESLQPFTDHKICRSNLIEIGNLASTCKTGSRLTFMLLTAILASAGYTWVVFTATSQVRRLLTRLKFEPVTLCKADANRLIGKSQNWGSYYNACPQVQAGDLRIGMQILKSNRNTAGLLDTYKDEIERLASMLRLIKLQG